MKLLSATGLLALASMSYAFPAEMWKKIEESPELARRAAEISSKLEARRDLSSADDAAKVFEPVPMFDAAAQYIDVTDGGPNPWVAPGPTDLRGPCPG
jgi:hypothetical protein